MSKEKFVYVTYIAATPEQAWQALVDGDMTRPRVLSSLKSFLETGRPLITWA